MQLDLEGGGSRPKKQTKELWHVVDLYNVEEA